MGLDQRWLVANKQSDEMPKTVFIEFFNHILFDELEEFMHDVWVRDYGIAETDGKLLMITKEILYRLYDESKYQECFFSGIEKRHFHWKDIEDLRIYVLPLARQFLKDGKYVFYFSQRGKSQ